MKWKPLIFILFICCLGLGLFIRNGQISFKKKESGFSQMTDNAPFLDLCREAVASPEIFSQFKRHPLYNIFHENLTFEEGLEALKILEEKNPDLLKEEVLEKVRRVDCFGNPRVYTYSPYGPFSPTTLLYLKIAGDIKQLLGMVDQIRVIEIGGGSGGLCKVLHEVLDIESYTIIDLDGSAKLIKKHIEEFGLNHVCFITPQQINLDPYDLVISYDGFSEANRSLQKRYMKKLFPNASNGYLVCNFYPRKISIDSFKKEELIKYMQGEYEYLDVTYEDSLMGSNDCILTWRK